MKYEDMKVVKDNHGFEFADNYHILGKSEACTQCGEMTRAIDVFSESHICSEECQKKFNLWCNSALNKMQEIDGVKELQVERKDMSDECGFKYDEYWMAANHYRTMSQEDWQDWYRQNCRNCKYMCEICMYAER